MRWFMLCSFALCELFAYEPAVWAAVPKRSVTSKIVRSTKCHPYVAFAATTNVTSSSWSVGGLCDAYNFPTGISASGVIGILELGGGWVQSDLDAFSNLNGLPTIQVTNVSVDGTQNSPGIDTNADIEVTLDIECAAASYFYATGKLPQIFVFFASNTYESFEKTITAASAAKCDVLSISWGNDEQNWEANSPGSAAKVEAAAQAATAAGMMIVAASGDLSSSDGDSGANVDVPAACPHVIGCGGTTKTVSSEIVWGDGVATDGGTGGGFSSIFSAQAFQVGAPSPPSGLGRMVPDIAADADPNTGIVIVFDGSQIVVGGTSVVAPFYAGLFAAIGKQLGFVSPTLWANPQAFIDITAGSNGAYDAGTGPDPCTGIGVPNGQVIANLYGVFSSPSPPPPSSGVVASFNAGILAIQGGPTNDRLTIRYLQRSQTLEVEGLHGTTVNGSRLFSVQTPNGFMMNADLGDGNDEARFIGVSTAGRISNVILGPGNDVIEFLFCDIGTLNVLGGTGTNFLLTFGSKIESLNATEMNVLAGRRDRDDFRHGHHWDLFAPGKTVGRRETTITGIVPSPGQNPASADLSANPLRQETIVYDKHPSMGPARAGRH